jgi:hypothetical protein
LNVGGDLAHGHDGAKRHVPVGQRIAVGQHLGARARTNAIGADKTRAPEAAAVFRLHGDAVAAFVEARHHGVAHQRDQRIAPTGIEQNVMQIDAMNDDVRIFEAGAERRDTGRYPGHLFAVEGVDHHDSGRRVGLLQHRRGHADAVQRVKDVGARLDTETDGAESARAFEHADRPAAARQRQGGGQSAESAAGDDDGIIAVHAQQLPAQPPTRLPHQRTMRLRTSAGFGSITRPRT